MSRSALLACLLAVLPLSAEDKYPYVVEVGCDRLNVRAGIGENYRILTTVGKGDRLVALGEDRGWVRIEPTEKIVCYVNKKYVERAADGFGIAAGDRVQLRPTADQNHPPMGQLNKAEKVEILADEGTWYKVRPPSGCDCWVKKDYLKFVSAYNDEYKQRAQREAKSQKAEQERVSALSDKFVRAEGQLQLMLRQQLSDQDFSLILQDYQEVASTTPDAMVKRRCEARIQELSSKQEIVALLREQTEARKQALEELHRLRLEQIREDAQRSVTAPPAFVAEGWVDTVGNFIGRPGTHKLIRGGRALFYLKSAKADLDLDHYYRQLVGIKGKIVDVPESDDKVIEVESVEVLGK